MSGLRRAWGLAAWLDPPKNGSPAMGRRKCHGQEGTQEPKEPACTCPVAPVKVGSLGRGRG